MTIYDSYYDDQIHQHWSFLSIEYIWEDLGISFFKVKLQVHNDIPIEIHTL